MDVTADEIHLDDLRAVDTDSVLGWRYGDDYMSYELAGTDRSTLADPTNEYLAVRRGEDLIGYVCLGAEARVAEMTEDPAVVDIGVGIRPDLTGRGESRWLMPAILSALDRRTGSVTLRAVVKQWNRRAQRAAEHGGFQVSGTHENSSGRWVLLIRRPSRNT